MKEIKTGNQQPVLKKTVLNNMDYLFLELSKYISTLLVLAYAVLSLCIFGTKSGNSRSIISGFQNMLNLLIVIVCFTHMYLYSKNIYYIYMMGFLIISLLMILFVTNGIYELANRLIINNMCMLLSTGLIIISRLSVNKAIKQYIIFMVCFGICMVIPFVFGKIKFFKKLTWVYAGIGLFALSAVVVFGSVTHGSKLSVNLGPVTFQPSEFVKILFIFFLAGILWNNTGIKYLLISAVIAASHVVILVISKDLGSALVFFVAYIFILFIATGNYLYFLAGLGSGCLGAVIGYRLFSHVRKRVIIWQDPWSTIDSSGYQIVQSLFSISNGGFWGTGLMKGTPYYIPFVESDCIFAAVCEELGIVYGIGLLLICISSFIEMLRIASKIRDKFYQLIVYGIAITLTFQVFLTVGGGTKFIPLTGVTLPLVSYGGTSLFATTIMYFIVQAIYIKLRSNNSDTDKLYKFHQKNK